MCMRELASRRHDSIIQKLSNAVAYCYVAMIMLQAGVQKVFFKVTFYSHKKMAQS